MTTPYEAAMRKVRRRWRELDVHDRKSDKGSSFGIYFQADELKALNAYPATERARIKRFRAYIKLLEDDLSYAGTPAGFTGTEWNSERDKLRKKLEDHGDLEA